MKNSINQELIFWNKGVDSPIHNKTIIEEPLSILLQGKPCSVIMRTPGDEIPHAAGFCLSEGIVDTLDDFKILPRYNHNNPNVVNVMLTKSRMDKISDTLDRKNYIKRTSCGMCGKELISELYHKISPVQNDTKIEINLLTECIDNLSKQQRLRYETKASHASAIYNKHYKLLSFAEDMGRHNALDKAIGKLFLDKKLSFASFLILSSRISYELVQKAAKARLPIIISISRPTSLAIELASKLDITLACLAPKSGFYIYTGEYRLKR